MGLQRAMGCLDMSRARLKDPQTLQLLVYPLQSTGNDLLLLERLFGSPRKALAARLAFATCLALSLAHLSFYLGALIAKLTSQIPQSLRIGVIDCRVVRTADEIELVFGENVAFVRARYGHRGLRLMARLSQATAPLN